MVDGFGDIFDLLEHLFEGFDFDFAAVLAEILALLGLIGGGGGGGSF